MCTSTAGEAGQAGLLRNAWRPSELQPKALLAELEVGVVLESLL